MEPKRDNSEVPKKATAPSFGNLVTDMLEGCARILGIPEKSDSGTKKESTNQIATTSSSRLEHHMLALEQTGKLPQGLYNEIKRTVGLDWLKTGFLDDLDEDTLKILATKLFEDNKIPMNAYDLFKLEKKHLDIEDPCEMDLVLDAMWNTSSPYDRAYYLDRAAYNVYMYNWLTLSLEGKSLPMPPLKPKYEDAREDDVFGDSFSNNYDDDSDDEGEIKFIGVNFNGQDQSSGQEQPSGQDQPSVQKQPSGQDQPNGQAMVIEPDSTREEDLTEVILQAHQATFPTSQDIREKISQMDIDQNKLDYYKNMVSITPSFCFILFSLTQMYLQSNEELWKTTAEELTKSIWDIIQFARRFMGGFSLEDKVKLTEGAFEVALINMSRCFDLSQDAVLFKDCMLPKEAFKTKPDTFEWNLVNQVFDFAKSLAELKLSDNSLALLSAYVLLQPGMYFYFD